MISKTANKTKERARTKRLVLQISLFSTAFVLCSLIDVVRREKHGVFIPTRGCQPYGTPVKRFEVLPMFSLLKSGRSTTPESGFCLCSSPGHVPYTTKHVACPKLFVDCNAECAKPHNFSEDTYLQSSMKHQSPECIASRLEPDRERKMSKLADDLLFAARRARMPAKLIGSRRRLKTDFTLGSRGRLPVSLVNRLRRGVDKFRSAVPTSPPEGVFRGRGIVIVGSTRNVDISSGHYINIHAIRRGGSDLPIEVWFPKHDYPSCAQVHALRKLGATARSFTELRQHDRIMRASRFTFKLFAVLFSGFAEILYLDADNIALSNVTKLFQIYETTGVMLWKDFWLNSAASDLFDVLPALRRNFCNGNVTHEAGQMLIDKTREGPWKALLLSYLFNVHFDVFADLTNGYLGWGDKELLPTALRVEGVSYSLVQIGPDEVGLTSPQRISVFGNSMLHFDDDGAPIFLHANIGKIDCLSLPSRFHRYNRRWLASDAFGPSVLDKLAFATGERDFERWVYDTCVEIAPILLPSSSSNRHRWWKRIRLANSPLLEGMFIDDHYYDGSRTADSQHSTYTSNKSTSIQKTNKR